MFLPLRDALSADMPDTGIFGFGLRTNNTPFIFHGPGASYLVLDLQERLEALTGTKVADILTISSNIVDRDDLIHQVGYSANSLVYMEQEDGVELCVGIMVSDESGNDPATEGMSRHSSYRQRGRYWKYAVDSGVFVDNCNCVCCKSINLAVTNIIQHTTAHQDLTKALAYEL